MKKYTVTLSIKNEETGKTFIIPEVGHIPNKAEKPTKLEFVAETNGEIIYKIMMNILSLFSVASGENEGNLGKSIVMYRNWFIKSFVKKDGPIVPFSDFLKNK